MRIHVTDIVDGDVLRDDVFNSYGLHILSKKAVLYSAEISKLLQHQIDYIDILERSGLINNSLEDFDQLERTLESTVTPKWVPQVKPIYDAVVNNIQELFHIARTENAIDTEAAAATFNPLLQNLHLERDVVSLLLLLNNQDSYTYQHSVQVGMLSYYLANWLGLSKEEATTVGNAGFLHDIGKCKLDESVLNKPGKLTAEEFDEIKRHTIYGYEIIMNSHADKELAIGALQHHERINGTGYPHGVKNQEISQIGRIIAVADIYSAMISSRVYQKERDLLFVLKELYRLSFSELDPVITHTFIQHMIPNFIGKRIKLNDGRTGSIIMTHPTEFFSPLIKIGHEFIDLTTERTLEITHVYF
ncbi:HD-GYP domain-containing protein [Paenibacillus endoradicis]|uniref:HD-GYP domain-containing protein n=1 Tax=Paenibacillus endoradicis TaxID=2972487 RepID=UPI0021596D61|nr:HD-GYP domain-containing protein [Paenibacillus endoradicis]MCR8659012.1 HD-GYP domain-containing protein [Paenibacillus endoradicis]